MPLNQTIGDMFLGRLGTTYQSFGLEPGWQVPCSAAGATCISILWFSVTTCSAQNEEGPFMPWQPVDITIKLLSIFDQSCLKIIFTGIMCCDYAQLYMTSSLMALIRLRKKLFVEKLSFF